MSKKSKRYKNLLNSIKKEKKIDVKEIISLVKNNCITKFVESIEAR